ncbi:ribosomal protein s17 [Ophiocordyceps sinensis CO18]|uniref:Ribosomal protein s17 n=1 Tax=Ophiocordyceps sinensis (strain Co18 / CGMCC 3.14243) TaxID=911162 RepID=T5AK77_OPHSC|nr:ribosomal protein s17 [Ophiocordyceps sinensis CO18]
MYISSLIALLGLSEMTGAAATKRAVIVIAPGKSAGQGTQRAEQVGNGDAALALKSNLVQTGSQTTGFDPNSKDNLTSAASITDKANFINFCDGKQLTNGLVIEKGPSCNGIPMGDIPAPDQMVSALFIEPKNGQKMALNQSFKIQVMIANLNAGSFTNATSTYYSAPQFLDKEGRVVGHTHITIQNLDETLDGGPVPDPAKFATFKAITDEGDGKGLLSTTVDGGLTTPGEKRMCTLVAAANHQPVIMAAALRGAQDDCIRFTVEDGAKELKQNSI